MINYNCAYRISKVRVKLQSFFFKYLICNLLIAKTLLIASNQTSFFRYPCIFYNSLFFCKKYLKYFFSAKIKFRDSLQNGQAYFAATVSGPHSRRRGDERVAAEVSSLIA